MILQEGLEIIGERCFADFYENGVPIREITIPQSVKLIGNGAFQCCRNLVSVTLQEGLESIGDECFSGDWFGNSAPRISKIVIP